MTQETLRVLVVDDDDAGRYLISKILSSYGHDVVTARNGAEALEVARACPPHVIVTDLLMPVMDGFQLAREWHADEQLSAIPLVVLTASYTDPADEKLALELGAAGFLSKPVEPATLMETIQGSIDRMPAIRASRLEDRDDADLLREYGRRVVHKLEQKLFDLEHANRLLEETMGALADEVDTKRRLIDQLTSEVAQRVESEQELRRERDFSRNIVENADVFICITDKSGAITLFSRGAELLSGYRSEEVTGKNLVDLFAPVDDRGRRHRLNEGLLSEGGTRRFSNTLVVREGGEKIIDWSVTTLAQDKDRSSGLLWFGIDATERSVATAAERTMSVIDLAVLLDRPPALIIDLTCAQAAQGFGLAAMWIVLRNPADGQMLTCAGPASPQLGDLFDRRPDATSPICDEDLCTLTPQGFLFTSDAVRQEWKDVAAAVGAQAGFIAPIKVHSEVRGALGALMYSPRGSEGARARALEHISDRIGVALAYSQAREDLALRSAALESVASAVLIANADGRVEWANRAFELLTGWGSDEVVGTSLTAEDGGYVEPAHQSGWQDVLAGSVWRETLTNRTKTGGEYVEDISLSPVRGVEGEINHVVIVKEDVSERARLEQLKSDFVSMVSHELRTPLTTIVGYGDLLYAAGSELPAEKIQAAASNIQRSSQKMQHMIEQLLDVNQIQAGHMAVEITSRDLEPVVQDVLSSVSPAAAHILELDSEPAVPAVEIDERLFARALHNVVDNAVKYSPQGGVIQVSIKSSDTEVVVAVRDEGIGIAEKDLSGIFSAFQQSDMSSTRSFGGVGLGLFLAEKFISAQGGHITVRSVEGEGSTFRIHLPRQDRLKAV